MNVRDELLADICLANDKLMNSKDSLLNLEAVISLCRTASKYRELAAVILRDLPFDQRLLLIERLDLSSN